MQSILRWSIENSTPLDGAPNEHLPVERKDLDPGIIDMILGKPDAIQMKEDMEVAVDASRNEDERINALDHMEMLVEHIDNANDLEKLKLWDPLQSLATAESSTPEIKTQALWVMGTAVQNNPSAQDVYLSYNPIPSLLSFLDYSSSSTTTSIRAKAIYTLSGLLKHNAPAVSALSQPEIDGWSKLRNALQDPSISVRRKVIFLLSSLLLPTSPADLPQIAPRSGSTATAAALHITDGTNAGPTGVATSITAPAQNILTPDQNPQASDPVFANSHAVNLQNPSRTSTCSLTLNALQNSDIFWAVINSLVKPLPYGEDGENAGPDGDFEEKAIHLVSIYAVTCRGPLSKEQKDQLKTFIQAQKQKEGEKQLLENWNLSKEAFAALVGKLL